MSQLTNFVKKVEQLRLQYVELSNKANQYITIESVSVDELQKILKDSEQLHGSIVADLTPTGEKLAAKLNQIDPITGERRFGQQSVQKFSAAQESLQSITLEIERMIQSIQEKLTEIKPTSDGFSSNEELTRQAAVLAQETRNAKLEAERQAEQAFAEQQAVKEAEEKERKRLEEERLLHEQAERIRQRKQQEQEMCQAMEHQVTSYHHMIPHTTYHISHTTYHIYQSDVCFIYRSLLLWRLISLILMILSQR